MGVGALLAAASVAQWEQPGEIEAGLYRADYSSSVLPAEAQQWSAISETQLALITITVILFGLFPLDLPKR